MSQKTGSSIVTDGLALYYDMGTSKSYRGKPTVNLVPTPDTMAGFSNYWYGPAVAKYFPDLGYSGFTLVNAGSWNGVVKTVTIPSAGTYTFSAWLRYHGGSANNNGGQVYINNWRGGGDDTAVGINKALVGIWQRVSITLACTTLSPNMYIISYGGTDGIDYSSWDIAMPQVEAGSVATPFVIASRTTVSAIVDLLSVNTITAQSITYDSESAFSFNGSSDYLEITGTSIGSFSGDFAIDGWMRRTAATGTLFELGLYTDGILFRPWGSDDLYINGSNYGNITQYIPINTWCHFTLTRLGSSTILYINGVQVWSATISTTINSSAANTKIGMSRHSAGQYYTGSVSQFRIYKNKGLSALEAKQNFNAHRGRFGV